MSEEPMILGERYRLQDVIGRGGMAEVWRAYDTRLDREVAIKRLRADLATDPTFQARFQREAQSAAGLNHPNIVAVYDTGDQVDPRSGIAIPYIVMELVVGHTLREVLKDGRRIVPEKALEFTAGVLDALSFSHKQGIVHRDIKPANVMLTDQGKVKVMDFGIARAVADTSATMTQTAAVIGTAQYLSPEQARGETVDARSDIYSAGCLLYELLTGRPPFVGDSPVSVAYQHVREQPTPPSHLDPEITPGMDAVTMTALMKNPAERYQSAREMRADIDRLLNGEAVTAVVPPIVGPGAASDSTQVLSAATPAVPAQPPRRASELAEPAAEPPRRRVSIATKILIALLVVLLGTLSVLAWRWIRGENPEPTTVQVPRVIGFQEEAARSQITNRQLVAAVNHTTGPLATKGQVVEQTPTEDTPVQVGTTVTITINDGPQMGAIPDGLVGLSEADARRALREAGFTNVVAQEAPAGTEPLTFTAGQVTSVTPTAGVQLNATDEVTIFLATGKSIVPNLRGIPVKQATDLANRSGFPNVVVREEASTEPVGQVIDQIPAENVTWNRSDQVTLIVARQPPVQTVTMTPTNSPTSSPTTPTSSPS